MGGCGGEQGGSRKIGKYLGTFYPIISHGSY